eukprot:TRINITY_DN1345_c2_g1_i1.p1 TRINITY_DN1345_c2_g1~~TRINITY_DN1345_c2_g1_i1.p1  ORF type:complete len:1279 (+),score=238.38 TRINITY_DN1345_c2_g1_i1:56-3838(+)
MPGKKKKQDPPPPPEKLISSEIVYKKVMWHPDVDQDILDIEYIDRFLGVKSMSLKKWREGGDDDFDSIPWHRVVAFKAKGVVFWDREARMNKLEQLFNGELLKDVKEPTAATNGKKQNGKAKKTQSTKRQFPRTDLINFRSFSYETSSWKRTTFEPPLSGNASTYQQLPRNLKMITWNVLFGKFDYELINCETRWTALLAKLASEAPDIVCLQETDETFTAKLLSTPYIRDNFIITDHQCTEFGPDSIILIENTGFVAAVTARLHQFNPHVNSVIIDTVIGGKTVGICSLHLTSDMATGAASKRAVQLESLFSILHTYDHVLMAGDFNFGDGSENDGIDWGKHRDAWTRLHGSDIKSLPPTFDPVTNPLAALNTATFVSKRMDRVVYRSKDNTILPVSINLIGDISDEWDYESKKEHEDDDDDDDDEEVSLPKALPSPEVLPADVQIQFVIRGLQASGKTTLSRLLQERFGGVVATNLKSLQRMVHAEGVKVVIVDTPHCTKAQLERTVKVLCQSRAMRYTILLDISAPISVLTARLKTGRLGAKAGHVLTATSLYTVSLTEADKKSVNLVIEVDGTKPASKNIEAIQQNLIQEAGLLKEALPVMKSNPPAELPPPPGNPFPITPMSDHYGLVFELTYGDDAPIEGDGTYVDRPVVVYKDTFHRGVALAVVVEGHPALQIAPIRRDLDKAVKTWPCHVNIMWPFIPMSSYLAHRDSVADAIADSGLHPFRLTLSKLKSFNDFTRNRASLWLDPETPDKPDCLKKLRKSLETRFVDSSASESHGFNPHMTIGRATPDKVQSIAKQYKWHGGEGTNEVSVLITHLTVLARTGEGEPMLPVDTVQLPYEDDDAAEKAELSFDLSSLPPIATPRPLLEPHPLGGRKTLDTYTPKDSLEVFMLHLAARLSRAQGSKQAIELCTKTPTHISQRGAQYHVPTSFLDEYLRFWQAARDDNAKTPFFMEEIRGTVFRAYVDVDIKLTSGTFDLKASKWLDLIANVAKKVYSVQSCMMVVTACHGKWECDESDVSTKSGFRVFFLDLYTSSPMYKKFIEELSETFMREVKTYPGMPAKGLRDVMDTHSVGWDRGRLLGTMKRRKDLARVYELDGAWYCPEEGSCTLAAGLTDHLRKHGMELCYSTMLRTWDGVLPSFAKLPATMVPETLAGYHYAVLPEAENRTIDLIKLKPVTFNSQVHTYRNTALIGYNRPKSLDKYRLVPYPSILPGEDEPNLDSLLNELIAVRTAGKLAVKEAEWRRILVSKRAYL